MGPGAAVTGLGALSLFQSSDPRWRASAVPLFLPYSFPQVSRALGVTTSADWSAKPASTHCRSVVRNKLGQAESTTSKGLLTGDKVESPRVVVWAKNVVSIGEALNSNDVKAMERVRDHFVLLITPASQS